MSNWLRFGAFLFAMTICQWSIGCPSCRDAVAAGGEPGTDLASGYAASVALLLAMPLALVSTGALAVWRAARRTRGRDREPVPRWCDAEARSRKSP